MSERVRRHLAGEPADRVWTNEDGDVIAREPGRVRVGSEREGFKQRVAHVEMLLTDVADRNELALRQGVRAALAELRGLLDETP